MHCSVEVSSDLLCWVLQCFATLMYFNVEFCNMTWNVFAWSVIYISRVSTDKVAHLWCLFPHFFSYEPLSVGCPIACWFHTHTSKEGYVLAMSRMHAFLGALSQIWRLSSLQMSWIAVEHDLTLLVEIHQSCTATQDNHCFYQPACATFTALLYIVSLWDFAQLPLLHLSGASMGGTWIWWTNEVGTPLRRHFSKEVENCRWNVHRQATKTS